MKKHFIYLMIVVLLAGSLFAGCGEVEPDKLEQIKSSGVLTAAVLTEDAPYSVQEGSEFTGSEIDLIRSAAEQMGLVITFIGVNTKAELYAKLKNGEADVAIGTISSEEASDAGLSGTAVYRSSYVFSVTKRGVYSATKNVFEDKTVGVSDKLGGTVMVGLKGVSGITIQEYESINQAEADITAGTIAAYICYSEEALQLMRSEYLQAQSVTNINAEKFVIAVSRDNDGLQNELNTILSRMTTDGSLELIFE